MDNKTVEIKSLSEVRDFIAQEYGFECKEWNDLSVEKKAAYVDLVAEHYASLQCAELKKDVEIYKGFFKTACDKNDSLKKDAEEWKLLFNQKLEQVKNAEAFIEKLQAECAELKKDYERDCTKLSDSAKRMGEMQAENESLKSEVEKLRGALVIANENTKRRGAENESLKKRVEEYEIWLKSYRQGLEAENVSCKYEGLIQAINSLLS